MERSPRVLLIAAMDTKGDEARYIKDCLEEAGVEVWILDGGVLGESSSPVRFDRRQTALAGGMPLDEVRTLGHEGRAIGVMARGAATMALSAAGDIDGIIGLGGSMGTTLCTEAMRAFPVGVPKMMITTMGSRDTRPFVGTRDICLLHAVVDLAGLNHVTRRILRNGAMSMAGMVKGYAMPNQGETGPSLAFSTLGTTEVCAQRLRRLLDERGFETITFHSNGAGGQAMEEMIGEGRVQAAIDLSLHELADHLFGGDYDAGPSRGRAAGLAGLPLVLAPGNIDFLVSGPLDQAQKKFPDRASHCHNPAITCMRTSRDEMNVMARTVADLANQARGPTALVVPLKGFSAFDHPEHGPLHDPGAPAAFVEALTGLLDPGVTMRAEEVHANDPEFADVLADTLDQVWSMR